MPSVGFDVDETRSREGGGPIEAPTVPRYWRTFCKDLAGRWRPGGCQPFGVQCVHGICYADLVGSAFHEGPTSADD